MPAHEHINDLQFNYERLETGGKPLHQVTAHHDDLQIGSMTWSSRSVRGIGTEPGFKRKGVATAMWHEGHRLAAENARIPMPKHSVDRTTAGDAWARSVGGRLPRRSPRA